ncbi:hypothetical protein [Kineococcus sp. G2]|uniref:hypothetical protein n=1 Tax=Kineococcus sp. G2 TaxID=3127484 RepID=UPI00301D1204
MTSPAGGAGFDPWAFEVRVFTEDPVLAGHDFVRISSVLEVDSWAEHVPEWTATEVLAVSVRAAGLLARLALVLQREVARLAAGHGCAGTCAVHAWGLETTRQHVGEGLEVSAYVPAGQGPAFGEYLGRSLGALVAEEEPFSEEEERAFWSDDDKPTSTTTSTTMTTTRRSA